MSPSILPVDARSWPARGQALAAWLNLGVDVFQGLARTREWEPQDPSLVSMDRLTFTDHEPRRAGAGPWFALLTLTGAGEMVRALATLYAGTATTPLTRGYLPILRSIQEHIGRVVWLCEPGASVHGPGETPTAPTSDEFEERRLRALLAYEEWMADCVKHFTVISSPDLSAAQQALDDARADTKASQDRRPQPATKLPNFTAFAELAETTTEVLHGTTGQVPPKMPYKRAAESSHAGLYGLHGDKTINAEDLYAFEQSDADLDAVAAVIAAWWVTGVSMVSEIHGWNGDAALLPFTETWKALY